MIVVTSSKVRRDKVDGLRHQTNLPQTRPVHPSISGSTRWAVAPANTFSEDRARFSREVPDRWHPQAHRYRTEAEIHRDVTTPREYSRGAPAYPYRQKPEVPPSAPPMWDSCFSGVGSSTDWRQNYGAASAHRCVVSPSWYTYQRNAHHQVPPQASRPPWAATHPGPRTVERENPPYVARQNPIINRPRQDWSWQTSMQSSVASQSSPPLATVIVNHDGPASAKRRIEPPVPIPKVKKPKSLDKLNLLCQATLEIGPMHENPTGCTCPKSKCIALYCDCFKAGRRCNPRSCGCIDCKNTVAESGVNGARTKAIRSILARNPRAFLTAGLGSAARGAPNGESACNCIRSRCLKLYCTCFQASKVCTEACTCVGCYNTDEDTSGERQLAIQLCLEKRPDAFETRVKEPGHGCACKNNRCVRKYCECFRNNLVCNSKQCSCRQCENRSAGEGRRDIEKRDSTCSK